MTPADLLDGTLYGLAGVALVASAVAARHGRGREWRLLSAAGMGLVLVEDALSGAWPGVAMSAAMIAVILGSDWWNRRGRKVAKVIGERGRAVIAGLVEKVRDAGSPLPEGARA